MQEYDSMYAGMTVALLMFGVIAGFVLRGMTPEERRLVTAAAIVMAGMTVLGNNLASPGAAVLGLGVCWFGVRLFVRARQGMRASQPTRAGVWAAVFVLPLAFFGALLAGGTLVTLLAGPAEAAIRFVGG